MGEGGEEAAAGRGREEGEGTEKGQRKGEERGRGGERKEGRLGRESREKGIGCGLIGRETRLNRSHFPR